MASGKLTDAMIDTDVLVIGGGLAGCWAAIRAKALAPRVTLVDKAEVARSGCSGWAYYLLAPPRDQSVWKQELVEKGNYLNDQEWVDVLLQEHGQRLAEMESWGVPFERDDKGELIQKAGRGHKNTRFVTSDGQTRMEAMKKHARDVGVQIIERIACTDLLTSDGAHPTAGSVIGAVGFHSQTGEMLTFRARSVVVATGPLMADTNLSGDGVAMSFRAGAEVMSHEFCISPTCYMTDGKSNFGTFNVLFQSLGLWLLNSKGERFMEKYSPVLKERSDWALLCQCIAKETMAGRGPALLDMSHVKDEDLAWFAKLHPGRMAPFIEAGIDLKRGRVLLEPYVSVNSGGGDGGLKIDTWGRSSVPGLYGAGSTCKNGVHGTYTVGGINLAFCCSSGYRAGEMAARDSGQRQLVFPKRDQFENLRVATVAGLGRQRGLLGRTIVNRMQKVVAPAQVSIVMRGDRIEEARSTLNGLRQQAEKARARDVHELMRANEAKNILLLVDLSFRSALERKESRHSIYREEYPYTDNIDWLKWVVLQNKGNGDVRVKLQPVPIERYSVRPEKRQRIPHPIQFP